MAEVRSHQEMTVNASQLKLLLRKAFIIIFIMGNIFLTEATNKFDFITESPPEPYNFVKEIDNIFQVTYS